MKQIERERERESGELVSEKTLLMRRVWVTIEFSKKKEKEFSNNKKDNWIKYRKDDLDVCECDSVWRRENFFSIYPIKRKITQRRNNYTKFITLLQH